MSWIIDDSDEQRLFRLAYRGAFILYRKLSARDEEKIRVRCTNKRTGRIHNERMIEALIREGVQGWEHVQDQHGRDVPYSFELLREKAPPGLWDDLLSAVRGTLDHDDELDDDAEPDPTTGPQTELEHRLGNSNSSSSAARSLV